MNTKSVLQAARDLLSDPSRWTTGAPARNAEGDDVLPNDTEACRWCALGAIWHVTEGGESRWSARGELEKQIPLVGVGAFNDNSTHAGVLELFDRAIAAA